MVRQFGSDLIKRLGLLFNQSAELAIQCPQCFTLTAAPAVH